MYYIGLMSGTSMDAIDVALVQFKNDTPSLIGYEQYPIDNEIRRDVRQLATHSTIEESTRLDIILGHLFADAILSLLKQTGLSPKEITAIGSHGQTILHLPDASEPRTLQIGDANIIAAQTEITTIADFRRMDIAVGGQGAPLAPAFHASCFHNSDKKRVILNLGGMANITVLPKNKNEQIIGFDTGPGNALLDDWIQKHSNHLFDKDAAWAKSGKVDSTLLNALLQDTYFSLPPPKSTGRDYFNLAWLDNILSKQQQPLANEDIQATLARLTVITISDAIRKYAVATDEILICGGGIHNPLLVDSLKQELNKIEINSTEKYGLHPDCIEAVAFAWLAKQRLDEQPGNLPSVTGANRKVILGAVYK